MLTLYSACNHSLHLVPSPSAGFSKVPSFFLLIQGLERHSFLTLGLATLSFLTICRTTDRKLNFSSLTYDILISYVRYMTTHNTCFSVTGISKLQAPLCMLLGKERFYCNSNMLSGSPDKSIASARWCSIFIGIAITA